MYNVKLILIGLFISLSVFICPVLTEPVISKSVDDLNSRWRWAVEIANARKIGGEFWIGYSIEHWMGEGGHICCQNLSGSQKIPFKKIIEKSIHFEKVTTVEDNKPAKPDHKTENLVLRKLAFLFKVKLDSRGKLEFSDVAVTDLDSHFNLKDLSLIWLDLVDRYESANYLIGLYEQDTDEIIKKDLITALGLHQDCKTAFEKLKNIINSNEPNALRREAVFWLAQQQSKDVLDFLKNIVRKDRSENVQEQAVFAIYLLKSDAATDELLVLARKAENNEVRKKAIFWLGQIAGEKAVAALENVVYHDQETEIQKQAVFALSQLPEKQGFEKLMKIARTHPNAETRKQAIFWIGQSNDERALDFLMAIIKEK